MWQVPASSRLSPPRGRHSCSRLVPHRHQRLHFSIAEQTLRVASGKQTSWVGRPDPDASTVFQPRRDPLERWVTNCRWAQSRLTCCVHVYTYSLTRERLIYVGNVTARITWQSRAISLKNNTKPMPNQPPGVVRKKGPSTDGPLGHRAGTQRVTGAGCCWVRQWMLPPPNSSSRPGIITTSWSGNIRARIALASASAGSSKLGAIMPPLTIRKFT